MSDVGRLAGFGFVLAAALGAGLGLGAAVGQVGAPEQDVVMEHDGPTVEHEQ